MITIVDYGMGNLGSMLNMLKRIGVNAIIGSKPEIILQAKKLILPGVGAFDAAMHSINSEPGLREALNYRALIERIPILGVCLGMQLLTRSSEEGQLPGLGWIPAETRLFPSIDGLKVPHMGWNIARANTPSKLTAGINKDVRYYFVHSYYVIADKSKHSLMRTHYGVDFDSAIGYKNILGVQFHPEKSHRFGMQLLRNFVEF
jgi:glutamine amidotransferase